MLRLIAKHADEWNVEISARARGKPIEFEVRKFEEYLRSRGSRSDKWSSGRGWPTCSSVRTKTNSLAYEDRIFPLPWGEESDMDDQLEDGEGRP